MKTIPFLMFILASLTSYAQEKLVKLKGNNYNVYLKGFENRKPNTPALIFESGMGTDLGNWDKIIDELAKNNPVFAYDRAGIGKSDKVFEMPTVKLVSENLKVLLTTLNIAPPYILIGHSLGGVYIRGFAGFYPNDISGLVFIDPADFTETKKDWISLLNSLDIPNKKVDEMMYDRLYKPSIVDSMRFGSWSEGQVLTGLRRTDFSELTILPLPNVPIYFFVGGRFDVPVESRSKDFDHVEFFNLKTDANNERWKRFINSSTKGGSLIYLTNCGHFVHRDDPKTVIANMKIMIENLKN
jgi:pimeloyl-ACP methyl ester carboxylesterase